MGPLHYLKPDAGTRSAARSSTATSVLQARVRLASAVHRLTNAAPTELPRAPGWAIRDEWMRRERIDLCVDPAVLAPEQFGRLFHLYDRRCLNSLIARTMRAARLRPIVFRGWARPGRYLGKVSADDHYPGVAGELRVLIAATRFRRVFGPSGIDMHHGIRCARPVDGLVVTIEHELVHVLQILLNGFGGHAQDFVDLAWRLFGHVDPVGEPAWD